jgi:hypothetical protein
MENTFTYTARSALAPEKVVTFTLYDHHMSVDLGAPLEQIEEGLADLGEEPEGEAEAVEETGSAYALKPTAVSLLETGTHPFDIADVYAQAGDEGLTVTGWVRAMGLRLAPIRFAWERVDNPQGAQAFAEQVDARRQAATQPGPFSGLMEYWFSWLLLAGLVMALFWPRRRHRARKAEQE